MTTLKTLHMGGNGAYSSLFGRVPARFRTQTDTHYRIDGHKVLVQSNNNFQNKTPMNSNSDNPIYLCGKSDKEGNIVITTIAIYKNHKLVKTIDLVTDKHKNLIPYTNGGKNSSHSHKWEYNTETGIVGRRTHDKQNSLPIATKYQRLINKIIDFNKSNKKWKKQTRD